MAMGSVVNMNVRCIRPSNNAGAHRRSLGRHTWLLALTTVFAAACTSEGVDGTMNQARPDSQNAASAEADVRRIMDEYAAAFLAKDTASLNRIMGDDYVLITPRGRTITKLQNISEVATGTLDVDSLSLSDVKTRVLGDVVIVTYAQKEKATVNSTPTMPSTLWTAVFLRRDGRWQIVAEHGSPAPEK